MNRIGLLLAGSVMLAALPYVSGAWQTASARPRQMILIALITLMGLATSVVLILATVAGPLNLPADIIPNAVGRCVDAAGRLFSHPLGHWPHILVALAVVALLIRLAVAGIQTSREAARWNRVGLGAAHVPGLVDGQDVVVIESREPLACTTGLLRPRIVVSTGLIASLDGTQQRVVLAHERAHVRGWHPFLLLFGRVVSRGFGFLPPVRRAVDQLLLGLELSADAAAVAAVGDPLVVAGVLTALAGRPQLRPTSTLGVDGGDAIARVRRLLADPLPRRAGGRIGTLFVVASIALFAFQVLIFTADARPASATARATQLHSVCHLPHP